MQVEPISSKPNLPNNRIILWWYHKLNKWTRVNKNTDLNLYKIASRCSTSLLLLQARASNSLWLSRLQILRQRRELQPWSNFHRFMILQQASLWQWIIFTIYQENTDKWDLYIVFSFRRKISLSQEWLRLSKQRLTMRILISIRSSSMQTN